MSHLLILGQGYTGTRLRAALERGGWTVTGTARTARPGILAADDPAVASAVAGATHILSSVPPEADGDVRVGGEVRPQVERVGQQPQPRRPRGLVGVGRHVVPGDEGEQRVGDDHLHEHAEQHAPRALVHALRVDDVERPLGVDGSQMVGGHVHPAAACISPAVSSNPSIRFIHCTAPPAAPLVRLSTTQVTTTLSP